MVSLTACVVGVRPARFALRFNIFNHRHFALPVNTINPGSSTAGQIVATLDVAQGNPGLGGAVGAYCNLQRG
jgi:hypothetical protein